MAPCEAVRRGRFVYKISLDFISNDPKASTGLSFCATGSCSGGRSCKLLDLNREQGGNAWRVQIKGGPCSIGARICLKQMGRKHFPTHSRVWFFLRKQKKKRKKNYFFSGSYKVLKPERIYEVQKFLQLFIFAACQFFLSVCLQSMYLQLAEASHIEKESGLHTKCI